MQSASEREERENGERVAVKKKRDTLPLSLIKRLHKAEIHIHLDGSIRIETLIALAEEQGVTLPLNAEGQVDEEEVRRRVQLREECEGMSEYLHAFDLALSVLQVKRERERGAGVLKVERKREREGGR